MPLAKDLLEILICPLCTSGVREEQERLHCTNASCGLIFEVKDGIPDLLIDEAQRPCPKCRAPRTHTAGWKDAAGTKIPVDTLACAACGETFTYERK